MTRSKECFKCKTVKQLSDFYNHPQMFDGHLNKCKECAKKDVNKHRSENLDKIREYDRQRGKLPERRATAAAISKAWLAQDLRRMVAHNAVHRAIIKGKIMKQPCIKCGSIKSMAHHPDYDKPLDVIWLCQIHHKQAHKLLFTEK